MTQLQIDYWNMVISAISTFVVIVVAMAGAIKYFQERQRDREVRQQELAWRKTQFILELADKFEKDEQNQVVRKLLSYTSGYASKNTLQKVLDVNPNKLNKTEMNLHNSIDHYLDFFDKLYHFTFVTRAIDIADIEVFGWYIAQINEIQEIRHYARASGFDDVLVLHEELRKRFGEKPWFKTVERQSIP